MQRYHAGSCTSAVNNSVFGGIQARDTSRAESPSVPPNFSLNPRRSSQPALYTSRCEKEQLNSRLGPPDFHQPTPNCPEETLTREYAQSGYRETVEGLEEGREISFSQVQAFTKPLIVKCKEAIRKCHRAINESRAQKRKAGQVYEVPLSGSQLTKSGLFPELRPCGEDFRKKWVEGLSQPHKRLRSLADHVPHGYRRKSLFEVLIRNNVPLLRATWFIKVTYLNQVRASSSSTSSSFNEKTQFLRSELWTKDVVEYLQHLLDELMARNTSHSNLNIRARSSQMVYAGSVHKKSDSFSSVIDVKEPSLHTKWWYVVRIIQWHYAEGLLVPSLLIDWVLNQLEEKESLGVLQLLLPIIYCVIETVILSQTYVRNLVGIAVRFIRETSPGGSDLVDNSRREYTTTAVVEMMRYLILAVPDTFVALDCFPLPACVLGHSVNGGNFLSKMCDDSRNVRDGQIEVMGARRDKIHEAQAESLSFLRVVSLIQKRAETLSRAARPNNPGYNVAKASQVLDQALVHGDIVVAYKILFENIWDGAWAQHWIAQVSRCLYTSLKHISSVTSSLICSVFLICEWATCEFRDFRTAPPHGMKFTGKRDLSQIFIAIRLLKQKMSNMPNVKNPKRSRDMFESPCPLHDIILCWIDQHEVHNREGFKRLQLLIKGLIQCSVFNPQAYVRQLIVSGLMDGNGSMVDLERRKRHHKLLKELPAPYIRDAMEETQMSIPPIIMEAMDIYSNERRLVLNGLLGHRKSNPNASGSSKQKKCQNIFAGLKLEELKVSISALLQLPIPSDPGINEAQGSGVKRAGGPTNATDARDEASVCEECKRAKRQKLSEKITSFPAGEEEIWWVNKELKYMKTFRVEPPPPPPPKPTKQSSRGRQKNVRKTQSLAQLADARIEGSQGASTSHACESKTGCPHLRTSFDETLMSVDGSRKLPSANILLIGKTLKKMQFVDKRAVAAWLISVVKQFIEKAEKLAAKGGGKNGRPVQAVDSRSSLRWRLGEDELSAILYIMDSCDELVSAVRFLLWLFSKLPSNPGSAIHIRNTLMLPRFAENIACDVGEAFLLSCIRRYENLIIAADLIPETLSATTCRAAAVLASNGRLSGMPSLVYARHLLRNYGNTVSVAEWQKTFTSTSDKRLSSELESGLSLEGEFGFPLGIPNGVEDPDDYIRQKITSVRVSRVGLTMKEIVHIHIEEVFQYFYTKDRKPFGSGPNKNPSMEKLDDVYQIAKQIVTGLMDCMRQTGGAAQEGDPSLVSKAIAAVVNNFGLVVAKIPDLNTSTNHLNKFSPPSGSLNFARHILRIHITCLCLLKEALGERQCQVFEVALATEASNSLMQAFTPVKGETLNHSNKSVVLGRASKISGAVSALVIGLVLQGVSSLERMVTLFRLKQGLDLIQFVRSMKSNVNGNSRSMGVLKVDNLIEVSLNWFRVLVGNCRTVADGLVVDLLGEASIVALFRMQRMLSLNVVFSPAFSIFAFVVWRPILDASFGAREDFHQLYHLLATGIGDAIKHHPFREICMRDTYGLYDIIAADNLDAEFVSLLEFNGSDINLKAAAFPLCSRLFLDALLDCKMPEPTVDKNWVSGHLKKRCGANVKNLMGKLVHVLDTLQPARFHWQWVELRLLLNEQAVNEEMENDISLIEAIKSLSPNPDKSNASESESNFIQIILTRLLVRPNAAPLFSEVVRLLGKSLEDSMLSQAKWLLRGAEVLYGKKSIRQKVVNIAGEFKELSLKPQHWKPWGWCSHSDIKKREKWKSEDSILEEGEVDGFNPPGKGSVVLDVEGFIVSQQHVTERALIELILPCLDQGSDDLRHNFASEMIKQMSNIEQQINAVTCGVGKQASIAPSPANGTSAKKSGSRKGGKSAISRQSIGAGDTVPASSAALRASMTLRLQFLIRLLPVICEDREPSGRNMRYALATVILRLLGSRVVREDAGQTVHNPTFIPLKLDSESCRETYVAAEYLCGENIFDCLLLVLHVLLSCYQPSWLKLKSESKGTDCSKIYAAFDREVAESLQNDLDRMELPETIRWRIQTAMPILSPSAKCSISCQPPSLPTSALSFLQPSNQVTTYNSNPPQRNRSSTNLKTKRHVLKQENLETDIIDPWTLLEDGAGSDPPLTNSAGVSSSDCSNLKASSLLKGALRVRRTDLSYIGAVDEDS
ncbi:hypothetical protein CASFOL_031124 [Castilleja foliolosa]|uniref:Mediator complex subunit Med12 domain-containing protein n=1 Tax=Castilleja foliolosa TaxID=1961234 RepID=A0ABD3C3V4_9LAMI